MSSLVAVADLRVGMYIHLDGGWLSHPFPLSAFRISTPGEINTIRGLGLESVRWVPEKSDRPSVEPQAPAAVAATPGHGPTFAAAQLQAWLAGQREAAGRCERQYGEAAKVLREVAETMAAQPQQAGQITTALTQAMLEKMLAADEVGIRLVHGGSDRGAAHGLNVAVISMVVGRVLGLNAEEMLDLGVGALLHDVGKLEVVEHLRHVEDGSSAAELKAYHDHVARGVAHGQRMMLSAGALAVIAQHHEHADGSGFPLRLTADRLTLAARIVAIVNRYDNLCNPRSRTLALTPHEAVATLFAQSSGRFDTPVLNAFIRIVGVYPAGSLVQLTDERYALVVGVNSSRPLKPRVLAYGQAGTPPSSRLATDATSQLLNLEGEPDLGIRRSLAANKLPPFVLAALDPRPRVAYYFEPLTCVTQAAELAA